jgi:hypothetical protein
MEKKRHFTGRAEDTEYSKFYFSPKSLVLPRIAGSSMSHVVDPAMRSRRLRHSGLWLRRLKEIDGFAPFTIRMYRDWGRGALVQSGL